MTLNMSLGRSEKKMKVDMEKRKDDLDVFWFDMEKKIHGKKMMRLLNYTMNKIYHLQLDIKEDSYTGMGLAL